MKKYEEANPLIIDAMMKLFATRQRQVVRRPFVDHLQCNLQQHILSENKLDAMLSTCVLLCAADNFISLRRSKMALLIVHGMISTLLVVAQMH